MVRCRVMLFVQSVALLIVSLLLVTSCQGQVAVESDSRLSYAPGSFIPTDPNYYVVRGVVVGDVRSIIVGHGAIEVLTNSPAFNPESGMVTTIPSTGAFFPAGAEGKGFLRLLVEDVTPETKILQVGEIALVKTTDTKAIALLPGDYVIFVCRAQFEAVGAVDNQEAFNAEKAGTWEVDYCRLKSPVVSNTSK